MKMVKEKTKTEKHKMKEEKTEKKKMKDETKIEKLPFAWKIKNKRKDI